MPLPVVSSLNLNLTTTIPYKGINFVYKTYFNQKRKTKTEKKPSSHENIIAYKYFIFHFIFLHTFIHFECWENIFFYLYFFLHYFFFVVFKYPQFAYTVIVITTTEGIFSFYNWTNLNVFLQITKNVICFIYKKNCNSTIISLNIICVWEECIILMEFLW